MVVPSWVFWIAVVAMVVGLIGVILPVIPGVGFIWLAVLAYALAERFAAIDPLTFVVLTVLGAVGVSADLWMSQLGAKVGGASAWSMVAGIAGGVVGAIVGAVFFGVGAVPGAILGALAGVVALEWHRHRDWHEAFKAGGGLLIGCTLSGGIQLVISLLMIVIFVWQVWKG